MDRAGRWAREKARKEHLELARTHWRGIALIVLATIAAFLPLSLIGGAFGRGVALGAIVVGLPLGFLHFAVLVTGTAGTLVGAMAAQWTAEELKTLRNKGWKSLDEVPLDYGDIDHVLIGPGGVVAIETKTSAYKWSLAKDSGTVAQAADQAWRGARRVRNVLKNAGLISPVRSLVVAWGEHDGTVRAVHGQVEVIAGEQLAEWIGELESDVLTHDEVRVAATAVGDYAERIDGQTRKDVGILVELGPLEILSRIWQAFVGFALATSIASLALATGHIALSVAALVGIAALGLVGRRGPQFVRTASVGWTAAAIVLFVLVAISVGWAYVFV